MRMTEDLEKIVVVLLSGGLDSCVAAAKKAKEEGSEVHLVTAWFGQTQREIAAAREISDILMGNHPNVADHYISIVGGYTRRSAANGIERELISSEESIVVGDLLKGERMLGRRHKGELGRFQVPEGYPFARDEALVILAASYAERAVIKSKNAKSAEVVLSTHKDDLSNFRDIHPDTYLLYINGILERKEAPMHGYPLKVELPLIGLSKREIVLLGRDLNAPIDRTWSCYGPGPNPCYECKQCDWRGSAFREAGVKEKA